MGERSGGGEEFLVTGGVVADEVHEAGGDLRGHGISKGLQTGIDKRGSVHPSGNPMRCSAKVGLSFPLSVTMADR